MADETGSVTRVFRPAQGPSAAAAAGGIVRNPAAAARARLAAPPPAPVFALFPDLVDDVRLEIGFGGGEH